METDRTPVDSTATRPAASPADPAHHGPHSGSAMWVMMLGCCLAIPLALIVGGVTAGGLAGAKPWLLGVAGALAVALVLVHRYSSRTPCDIAAGDDGR